MKHRKKNVLGLLIVAALGLMAFAASAQAVKDLDSNFFINNSNAPLLATFTGKQLGRGTLLIEALKTEVNCEKATVTSGHIASPTDATGSFLFEECTVLIDEPTSLIEAPGCKIVSNHEGTGKPHITASALFLPAELLDGSPAILAEKVVASVLIEPEKGCLLPKTTNITGELCIKVDENHKLEPILLSSAEIQGLCLPRLTLEGLQVGGTKAELEKLEAEKLAVLDVLKFGINPASVTGTYDIHLTGAHEGKTLGVLLI